MKNRRRQGSGGGPYYDEPAQAQEQAQDPYDEYGYGYDNEGYEDQVRPANPVPPPFENESPITKKRKCRDVLFLLLFFGSSSIMVGGSIYTFTKGDYKRFIHGVDLNCDLCGLKNPPLPGVSGSGKDLTGQPYLQTLKMLSSVFVFVGACRAQCPIETKRILNRCLPIPSRYEGEPGIVSDARSFFTEVGQDLEHTWSDIGWMSLIALGSAVLITFFLRLFAGLIIIIVIVVTSLGASLGSAVLWLFWWRKKADYDAGRDGGPSGTEVAGWMGGAILATLGTAILIILVLTMWKRVSLLIRLFKEAGKAVHDIPFLLFQPIFTFIALAISISSCLAMAILIESSGTPSQGVNSLGDLSCEYKKDPFSLFSRWWNLFMILWMTQFIVGCQHVVIAGAVSTWFFTRDKRRLGYPILESFQRLIRYHLGSIAFGSLLVATVSFARFVLTRIQNRLRGNAFCNVFTWACQCCLWCLEKFLKFLNTNAYIEIAIHGDPFCKSARTAFQVIATNTLRIVAINSVGDCVLFLAKWAIVVITVVSGHELVKGKEGIHYSWAPVAIGGILAYVIAHCCISVYEMTIDTVFLCFCEDVIMNDGVSRPYFMSKGLMRFVKDSKRALRAENRRKEKAKVTEERANG